MQRWKRKYKFISLFFVMGFILSMFSAGTTVKAAGSTVPACLTASLPAAPDGTTVTGTFTNDCAEPLEVGILSYITFRSSSSGITFEEFDGPYSTSLAPGEQISLTVNVLSCDSKVVLFTGTNPYPRENHITQRFYSSGQGYCTPASLGDFVWEDSNANGIQDAGEPGVSDVPVELFKAGPDQVCGSGDEVLVASTVTDANGLYQFTDLVPAPYCVGFTAPPDFSFTSPNQGNDPELDSDVNPATGQTERIDLGSGENDMSWDAGLVPGGLAFASVGDRVWFDDDGDGVQDAGEAGIPNVTVNLTDCTGNVLASVVTDSNGNYLFDGLGADTYCVVIDQATLPGNVQQTFEKDGTLDGDTQQALNAGDVVLDVDFGYQPLGSIGDTVFEDTNGNGMQDAGEPGIPNVTVDLTCAGPDGVFGTPDDIMASASTDANGHYLFTDLPAGVCEVNPDENTVPAGYSLTTNNDPQTVDLGPGEDFLDADFGYRPGAFTLGNRVWYDQNQNGIQDSNEPGYNGAAVELFANASCSGTPIASSTTGPGPLGFGDGFYEFTNLAAGDYCVQFGNIPAGWSISPADQGDGTNDSSADGNGRIANISLTADDPHEDMGIFVSGSLGDSVVCATTGTGLANITVTLFEDFNGDGTADGPAVATTETDAAGFYQFTGLETALAGDPNNTTAYIVAVDVNDPDLGTCNVPVPPTEYNPELDSNMPDDPNNDFTFTEQSATVGDRVWFDDDGDGFQDAAEDGIPGVTVNLTDCSGNILASDITDANGSYLFTDLAPGTYCIVIDGTTLPDNVRQTYEKDGTLDGDTAQTLHGGDTILDVDFGYQPLGSIGDTVFEDTNGNGMQDAGEPGIPNVTVDLTCAGPDGVFGTPDDIMASASTDADGHYLFTDLPAGVCEVNPDENTVPAGYSLTTNNDPQTVDLGPGEDFLDADFGYQPQPATVGDRVWFDDNGDGVQDAGEAGIPNVTVNLTDCTGNILATDVTDGNGNYLFDGLPAGTYCVVIDQATLPENVAETFEKDGTLDGDTQQALNAGDVVLDVDFGYRLVAIALEKYTRVEATQTGGDLCAAYGKPQTLTMLYTGDNVNDNSQDPSKVTITGDPMFATPVHIVASEREDGGGKIYFDGTVNLNETFVIDAKLAGDNDLRSNTWVTVYDLDGNVLQSINFHTSCSQPLFLGDQFGSIQLVGFMDKDGNGADMPVSSGFGEDADTPTGPTAVVGDTIVWTYIVSNAGTAPLGDVSVTDDAGTPDDPADDFLAAPVEEGGSNVGDTNGNNLLDIGEEWQFTASGTAMLGQYGNVAVASGTASGITVSDDDPSHYLGEYSGADLCDSYGKPQILTMLYTGDNVNDNSQDPSKVTIIGDPMFATPVHIVASEREDGGGKIYFDGTVNLGETFVIDAKLAGDNDLRSNTWVTVYDLDGNVLQSINFHTSCSQPLALGDQFGSIQLVGFQDKDGNGEGEIPPGAEVRADLCDSYGKPQILTILYTGDNVNDNAQDPSKVTITGDPMFATPVHIVASERENGGGKIYFDGTVNLNETFVIDARLAGDNDLRSNTWITVYDLDGNVLQSINFHTSCSQPLSLDDQFGSIQLVGFQDKNGNGEGEFPPGAEGRADLCDSYGRPQLLTMIYTGDNVNDNLQDPSKVTITGDPMFATPVHIVASERENGGGKIYFDGTVNLNDSFVIDATLAGDNELRSNTWVTIYDLDGNVLQSINFHTSCSQPLTLGDQFGGIELVAFVDKNGNGDQLP